MGPPPPPPAAPAVLRGPLGSCPRLTPPHPICRPASRTGIKRSTKPSTGRRLRGKKKKRKLRLTLENHHSPHRRLRQLLHARTQRFVRLFACLFFLPSPPSPSRSFRPGAVPGPSHTSRRDGARCRRWERPQPPARRRHSSPVGEKNRRFAVAARSSAQAMLKASLPRQHGRQGSLRRRVFLPVGIKVETKRLSCPAPSGVISPRGQKGTRRAAGWPQHPRAAPVTSGQYAAKGKFTPSPPKALVAPALIPAPISIGDAAMGDPQPTHICRWPSAYKRGSGKRS